MWIKKRGVGGIIINVEVWINVERGVGAEKTWISFLLLYFLGLLNDSLALLKAFLVVFGQFLHKTEDNN